MLKRKMIRDMIEYKVQFISIFLMAFIGVSVLTGMYMDTINFETTLDDYYEETNLILMPAFGNNFYLIPSISNMNAATTLIIILSITIATNMLFSYKIKKLDMADSLKELER